MEDYSPQKIEKKWQERWQKKRIYKTPDQPQKENKSYVLGMFPYPSGAGLHTGHVRIYMAVDVLARYFRMKGKDVLDPMGWDAFGLPAENAAIKERKNPNDMVPSNEANFRRQCQMIGLSYDWDRELSTADPDYYKWTQWLFLQFYKIKSKKGERIIYRKKVPINWCPFCKTGLADEEVLPDGTHERCGRAVTKKNIPQWIFRITDYADRLLEDLETLDWPEGILQMQREWIGRSEGTEIDFTIPNTGEKISVFTTRPDTIFGATFFVLAPEHPMVSKIVGDEQREKVEKYIEETKRKSELQRISELKDKTGVFTGGYVVNPANNEKIPVWLADFVLMSYGTGAIMGVPGHDQRDWDFAQKYGLEIKEVVSGGNVKEQPYVGNGNLVNSGEFNGINNEQAKKRITQFLKNKDLARSAVRYHLRDWIFSRQRYWGEPIPLVYCDKCGDENGVVPVPESDLPIKLPYTEHYEPSGTGESPLAKIPEWVKTRCPKCGGPAIRETDTMPNWAGSCWYFLRFSDPDNKTAAFDKEKADFWHPVDWYIGGAEHAVLHLLYARFWVKMLYDLGKVSFNEPFRRLRSVGMVLAKDGKKMSKSLGNIVNPDDVVENFGADTLRVYEMFMGPFSQAISWDTKGVEGAYRFLDKIWRLALLSLQKDLETPLELKRALHRTIKKIGEDIVSIKFNTALAAAMEFSNLWKHNNLSIEDTKIFLRVLAPFAPHITEELWEKLGGKFSIHKTAWPEYDPELIESETFTLVVQINGKVRDKVEAKRGISESEAKEKVFSREKTQKWIKGKQIKQTIFVPDKLINFVIK